LPSRNVRSIREDAEGKLWINTISGLACCAGGKLQVYTTYSGKAVSEFFLKARDGSMWFRSGMDVLRFGADGSIATLPGGFVVQEARDGSVWEGFGRTEPPVHSPNESGRRQHQQLAIRVGRHGQYGLPGIPHHGHALPAIRGRPLAHSGRRKRYIGEYSLVDREGNRWVGTAERGLFRFRRAPLTAYGKDEGLSDSPFRAVFQDRDGRIWLGGDAAAYWFDGHRFHLVPGLEEIGMIAQTNDGDLWFGGSGAVYRWRSGVLTRFRIASPGVFQILQDREGTLWIVAPTYEQMWRLYRFREGEFEQTDPDVVHMAEDRNGGLWLGGVNPPALRFVRGGKTVRYDQRQGMPPNGVHSFFQEPSGALWFSTTTGLYRLQDGRFGAITAKNGLTTEVTSILDDGKGNLWLPSEQGIFRLTLKEANDIADGRVSSIGPFSYGVAEGMKATECNGGVPGACKARDGRLWFPTTRGVVAIDPDAINGPPPVVIEEAWANKVKLGRDGRTSVPAGNKTLDFTFTALNLSAPERQRFKYRLQPFDKGWVDAGTQRTAHYTNMAPGEYSFQVIAADSYGIWNDRGASVRFVLRPHFHQTNWFYALCSIGFLVMLWMVYQFRLRQLQGAFNMRLEERVEERTRIARELHDTLLQSFQGSLYRFQAARNLFSRRPEEALDTLDSAIGSAESALAEGRDAIQNLRLVSAQRRLEDLLTATGKELQDAQEGNSHSAVFQVTIAGQPRTLSPLLQDEIYRIAREVLRNAFQHACARRIEAAIQYDPNLLRLRIRDDGKGIDPKVLQEGARAGHWGLPGIRERAKRIGAQLKLWSENAAGTEVELTVPASVAYAASHVRRRFGLFRIKSEA
jgi:signal transduction histidine kinase